jgi:hypothetical protein
MSSSTMTAHPADAKSRMETTLANGKPKADRGQVLAAGRPIGYANLQDAGRVVGQSEIGNRS